MSRRMFDSEIRGITFALARPAFTAAQGAPGPAEPGDEEL